MANEELTSGLGPDLLRLRREWFLVTRDTTLTVGTATYPQWTRSMMGSARDVGVVSNGVFHALAYLTPEQMDGKDPTHQSTPTHYTVRGTDFVLYPTPNAADTLRATYIRRMNRLVLPATVGVVTGSAVNVSLQVTITIGVNYSTLNFTTSTPLDLVRGTSPWKSVADSVTPTSIITNAGLYAAGSIPLLDSTTADVTVGDYLCLAGTAPVLQLPEEAFAVLAQRVANSLLRPGRDRAALLDGERELQKLEASVFGATERRVETQAQTAGPGIWA